MNILLITQYAYEINNNTYPSDPLLLKHFTNYHKKVYETLVSLKHAITVKSGLESNLKEEINHSDIVFSLRHDFGFINSDLSISLKCAEEGTRFIGNSTFSKFYDSDKIVGKLLAEKLGIPTPKYCFSYNLNKMPFKGPYLIKPRFGATSRNISDWNICSDEYELREKFNMLDSPKDYFIEKFIIGKTLTVGCIKTQDGHYITGQPYLLSSRHNHIITYEDKRSGSCIKELDSKKNTRLKKMISSYFSCIQPCQFARFDFIKNKYGQIYFLEINTTPNLSYTGSFFKGLETLFVTYENFIDYLLNSVSSSNK